MPQCPIAGDATGNQRRKPAQCSGAQDLGLRFLQLFFIIMYSVLFVQCIVKHCVLDTFHSCENTSFCDSKPLVIVF